MNPASIFDVTTRGSMGAVINLEKPDKLEPFVALIRGFRIDPALTQLAQRNSMPPPVLIQTVGQLINALIDPNWRQWPALFGVPSTAQLFARHALDAGIEGIVYPSKFNTRQNIAVFPQSLSGASFVELADPAPPEVKVRRLDGSTAANLP